MLDVQTDLWTTPCTAICITTNSTITKEGFAVMGRGCALQAKERIPDIHITLGYHLKFYGNHVHMLGQFDKKFIYSFPVKVNWWEKADLELIRRSCCELERFARYQTLMLLPRPGCDNRKLKWEDVRAVIEPILPLNVVTVYK